MCYPPKRKRGQKIEAAAFGLIDHRPRKLDHHCSCQRTYGGRHPNENRQDLRRRRRADVRLQNSQSKHLEWKDRQRKEESQAHSQFGKDKSPSQENVINRNRTGAIIRPPSTRSKLGTAKANEKEHLAHDTVRRKQGMHHDGDCTHLRSNGRPDHQDSARAS